MANTIALKRRITSVKNTKQITKAMELVSASKMRRAQDQVHKSYDYAVLASQILTRLRESTDVSEHPLFKVRPIKTRLYLVIASDRGLAGAYNSNVLKKLANSLQEDKTTGIESKLIVIGKQTARFVARLADVEVIAAYTEFIEQPDANDLRPILNTIIEMYKNEQVDAVDALFTDYRTSISQEVTIERMLPAAFAEEEVPPDLERAIFEPSAKAVLDGVTERLIESHLSQVFYEAQASEHSMRMMAMKNATDNANDLVDDLTLAFNTARQASITQELAEITGGAEAIK